MPKPERGVIVDHNDPKGSPSGQTTAGNSSVATSCDAEDETWNVPCTAASDEEADLINRDGRYFYRRATSDMLGCMHCCSLDRDR